MHKIYEIGNVAQLNGLAGNLDSAHVEKLFYGQHNNDTQEAEDHKAIVNSTTNKIEMTAKKNYTIIQNSQAIQAVVETLQEKGLEIYGRFDDFGGRIKVSCYFTNQGAPIVSDDAQGIKLGFTMENSYNGGASFKLSMYGFRMLCQNGMNIGSVMNNISEYKKHTGAIEYTDLKAMTKNFFELVIASSKQLEELISVSIKDIASWENVSKVLMQNFAQKKHRNKIAEKLGITFIEVEEEGKQKKIVPILEKDGKQQYTRWELYNAITAYATHNDQLSLNVSDLMQEGAQRILSKQFEKLLTVQV